MSEAVIYNQELLLAYRPFAASNSRGIKQPCWQAKVHWDKTNKRPMSFKILFLMFVLSLWVSGSPAQWFYTTWMASCKWPIALLIADFDQKTAKLHRKFKWPFPAKLLWVNVWKRILTLSNRRFLWCSSIAAFFGRAIDSVGCLFCLFLPWLFSPFFLSVGSFP